MMLLLSSECLLHDLLLSQSHSRHLSKPLLIILPSKLLLSRILLIINLLLLLLKHMLSYLLTILCWVELRFLDLVGLLALIRRVNGIYFLNNLFRTGIIYISIIMHRNSHLPLLILFTLISWRQQLIPLIYSKARWRRDWVVNNLWLVGHL